jgi:hypothetical protein
VTAANTPIDLGTYAALASVGAITTAILAVVAFIPFSDCRGLRDRLAEIPSGQAGHADLVDEAHRRALRSMWLVLPVAAVNVAVLAAWYDIGIRHAPWRLWLPWAAVGCLVIYLACVSTAGMLGMRRLT